MSLGNYCYCCDKIRFTVFTDEEMCHLSEYLCTVPLVFVTVRDDLQMIILRFDWM